MEKKDLVKNTWSKKRNGTIYWQNDEPHLRSPDVIPEDSLVLKRKGFETIASAVKNTCAKFGKFKKLYSFRKVTQHHKVLNLQTKKEMVTYEHGPIQTISYAQYYTMTHAFSCGLTKLNENLQKPQTRIGICLPTCLQWIMTAHGAFLNNLTLVTMYVNLGKSGIEKILNETELETLVTSENMVKFFSNLDCPKLKYLVIVGDLDDESAKKNKRFRITSFESVVKEGSKISTSTKLNVAKENDVAFLMYTSGTTGDPKGVILSHANIMIATEGFQRALLITSEDRYISYLPMAHIFEQAVHHVFFFQGASIGFGNPRTLLAKPGGALKVGDLAWIQPTFICGVPRVWDTIRKTVIAKVCETGGLKQKLFNFVFSEKENLLNSSRNESVALEGVIFKKVRALFGGAVRVLISGGAPMSKETQLFFTAALGTSVAVTQGYGLTETCAATTVQLPRYNFQGFNNVGQILDVTEVKLISVTEMGYDAKDLVGEVCIKSPTVTRGYFKRDKLNKQVFKDGWFLTGDIGRINKNGTLSIIDRRKNLAKLSNGKYVSLIKMEVLYGNSPFVQPNGVCVFADSLKDHIVAIILVEPNHLKMWTKENAEALKGKNAISSDLLRKAIEIDLVRIANKYGLGSHETLRIGRFEIFLGMWSPADDTTTAAFKLKRRTIKKKYEESIAKMYGQVKEEKKDLIVIEENKKKDVESNEKIPSFFKVLKPF